MLKKIATGAMHGDCTEALHSYGSPLLSPIVQRCGDTNPRVSTLAEELLQLLMANSGVGIEPVVQAVLDAKSQSFRAVCSRLSLISFALKKAGESVD